MSNWTDYFSRVCGGRLGLGMGLLLLATTACQAQPDWTNQNQAALATMNMIDTDSLCLAGHSTTTRSNFFILLSVGLLTGLSHCVGMCGPLVGAFTMRRRADRQEVSTPLVLFQLGRLTTYLALGLLLGSGGYFLAAAIRDWQGLFSVILGVLMLLFGFSLLGWLPLQRWLASVALARRISGRIKQLLASNHPAAPFGLGLANGLLPCGPVYAMGLLAATSGAPFRGAGVMLIFGLGTLPAMLGLGFSTSLLSLRFRQHLYRTAAILVALIGVQLALRGLALSGQVSHFAVGGVMVW